VNGARAARLATPPVCVLSLRHEQKTSDSSRKLEVTSTTATPDSNLHAAHWNSAPTSEQPANAARAVLRDAHDTAYACGATELCDCSRAELLVAGGRPRPPAGAGAAALTTAERHVADLATNGLTNRQIARILYLSPKTIEMHLRSVYRKLDLPGRDHLASAVNAP
jgi:DNA-binding CsgD family transcriptional regulator